MLCNRNNVVFALYTLLGILVDILIVCHIEGIDAGFFIKIILIAHILLVSIHFVYKTFYRIQLFLLFLGGVFDSGKCLEFVIKLCFYSFAKLNGVFVHRFKLAVVNEHGVLKGRTNDSIQRHNDGKLNKER